ncbi:MAG: hypothetical protein ABI569_10170 [Casimicrobiaceae bacterium]
MNEHLTVTTEPADDWLDAALRADARDHRGDYLADDGFTARVMATLPVPATLPAWRKRAVIGMWTVASVGIAVALPGAYADVAREFFRVVVGHPVSLAQIATGVVMLGIGSWTAMVWALRRS